MNKNIEIVERASYSLEENKKIKNVGVACYAIQDHKAITLVALIITIIVILILAGVTLSITLGENGIFSQSKLAVQKYENAKLKEEKELQDVSNLISNLGVASNRDEPKSNEEKIEELETTIDTLKKQLENLTGLVSENGGINPPGTIIAYATNTAPVGYLKCEGQEVSRSIYEDLFNIIGTTYGAGDGTNTFNVPDLRGEFLRGTGMGYTTGENVGTHQDGTGIPYIYMYPNKTNPSISMRVDLGDLKSDERFEESNRDKAINAKSTVKALNMNATLGTSGMTSASYMVRPTNTSVLYCIKY